MPLSCDCYGGCWGDHSANWSSIAVPQELLALGIERRDYHALKYGGFGAGYLIFAARLPYGEYVTDRGRIRVERAEHLVKLQAVIDDMRAAPSVEVWFDAIVEVKKAADRAYWDKRGPAVFTAVQKKGEHHATFTEVG